MSYAHTLSLLAAVGLAASAQAQPTFRFTTGDADGLLAAASRPPSIDAKEIEAADDFILTNEVKLTSAHFVGLFPSSASIVEQATVEIYRVFSLDSDLTRTPRVPTRNNSPSDNAFATRDTADANLSVRIAMLSNTFTAANSILDGIHAFPDQLTHGEGPVTGAQVRVDVNFDKPIDLPPGHYFIVPQVQLKSGQFFWLSAPRPIVAPGNPFVGDLQAWIRNAALDPDWLRMGTDIIGGTPIPTFNMAFSLTGSFPCYANCDSSTSAPTLNINDFICFLNRFAAGDTYANCDGSDTAPVLNVNDFGCFLNKFAGGCP